jgi:hypothetical protein
VQNGGKFRLAIYFSTDKSWTGSTRGESGRARGPPWTDSGTDRGCQSAAVHSPDYGLRPLRCTKAHGGGAKEREEHVEFDSGLTKAPTAAWRPGDGGGTKGSRELGGEGFRRGRGEGKGSMRCEVLRGSSGWF